ncbi:hypothetical protein F7725_002700 [Dissostichus mawsoni]|uniref:Titin n=1 Tax=Dissostichus mawsoni TaxID=36200 RepID=A0A7J5Y472_DISMA|nr:hypothetical protein F7725_002700 [Dissostichus mawsoni]
MLKLNIKEATRDDIGKYHITLKNTAGEATADIGIVVLDKPGQPGGPVKVEEVTSGSVTIAWSRPVYDGGCTIKHYIVEKRDTSTTAWMVVSPNLARTKIKAGRLKTGSEYQFRITAENRYGKGPVLLSESPRTPGTPNIAVCTKDSMVVAWNEPVNDGGSTILGYHLDRKERNSIMWVKLNKSLITDQTFKTSDLEPGMEYEYRVYAENIVGIGKMSKVSEGRIARDPCDPPGTPEATKIGKDSITIVWNKPEYDGGSKVTGYIVEKKELPEGRWLKANFTNVIETEYVATGLVQDSQYEFRVIARNAAGVFSMPSYSTGPITAKDEIEPPRVSIDPEYTKTIVVNAGDNFKIDADVHGKPLPSIQWMMGENELGNTIHREIKNTPTKAYISFKEAKLTDGGQYILLLKNPGGEKSVEKPGEPQGPLVITGITKDRCCLSWKPPVQDGGSKISHYIVKRRETSRLVWTVVDSNVETIFLKITKLLEGNEYIFRVHAVNQYGVGAPLESDAVTIKDPYAAPGTPKSLEVSDIRKDSMMLTWEAPSEDGGSPITGYIIEKHDKEGVRWTRCNRKTVTDLTFKVPGLLEGHCYEFRVAAENAVGTGEPSSPTVYFRSLDPIFRPGPPHNPKVTDTSKTSVFLSWSKPACDGGCAIEGYIVECCATTESALPKTKYEVANLKENQAYKFRVCAINKVGVGEPADVSGAVVAKDRAEEPDLDIDAELRKIVTIKAGASLRLFIPIKGRPTPTITWDKDEAALKETAQVEVTSSYSSLVIDKMSRNDSGKYTITAENASGTKSAFVVVRVLDTPSAPVALKVKEITNQSVTLEWEPPLLDGGSKIKNYVIEKRESTRKTYAAVSTNCHKLSWKIEPLQEGCSYYFRVLAENGHGVGLPATTVDPLKVSEVPQTPKNLIVTDQTKTSISLAWEKPEYDGGSRVIHYLLEVQLKGQEKWNGVNTFKTMETTVTKLNPGDEYLFRVTAINDKGKSDPKVLSGPVMTTDLVFEPEVRPAFSSYSVLVGKDLNVDVPIYGRPKPKVLWSKDGASLKFTTRVNILNSPTHTTLSIKEAAGDDGGMYSINLVNSAGKKDTSLEIIVLDKPGPPSGPVRFDEITTQSITLSWDPPKHNGGCQISNYIVQKRDTTTTSWENVSNNWARTTIKVPRLKTGSEYQFRIIAQNRYGKIPIQRARSTRHPFVSSLSRDHQIVEWNEPVVNGGSPVLGYHLERKERNSILWIKINKTLIHEPIFKSYPLEESIEYEYRVYAENIVGIGRCSKLSEGCVARDPCDPPGTPEAIHVTKDTIIIQWTKPEYDGGSNITGYTVERRDLPEGRWVRANFTNVIETKFTVTGLTENAQYDFRVIAKNAVGTVSKPSYNSGPITVSDEFEAPKFSIDPAFTKTIIINAGETFKLDADVSGKPAPTIQWFKGEKPIENTLRLEIKNTENHAMIVIKDSIRVDGGDYTLQLTNCAGSGGPGQASQCEGPLHIAGVAEDRCTLAWRAPLHDGGSPIKNYLIERRETSRLAWTIVSNSCEHTCYKVTNLLEGNEYMFRVMAVNGYGISEPLLSSSAIMKTPFIAPGQPHMEEVTNIAHDGMTVSWSAPDTEGGSEITNYIVEKKDRQGIKWTRCNRQKVTDLSFRVTGLTSGHEYEFRVTAENVVGAGVPSLPTPYYKASDPKYKPGAPAYVNVSDSTKSSISVSWGKPLSDGGSEIQGYIVEVCKAEEEEWTMVTPPTGLRVNKYEITKLTEGQEYKIQVCALNKLGVGEPASLSGTAKPEERVEPPLIMLDSELRKGIIVKAGGSVRIHIPFKGRPTPEVKWTKDEGDLTEKAVVEKALNFTQLSIDSCDRNDSGKYSLSLTNSSGTVSEIVSVKVLDTPSAPLKLAVQDIRKDSVTLVWEAPLIDGGSKIKNYVIDKRESTRKAYANVSTKCTSTTFKVDNLIEGALYYFRVMAENDFGIGSSIETKAAFKASEVPMPVGKISITDVTKATVSLAWEKPEHDGGSRIGGYLIEMQPKGTDKWEVPTNTKTCDGTVKGLTSGAEYFFRVIAYNEKGKSEPIALAAPIVASDMTMEPSIKMQFNTYSVLAGKDLRLEFPLLGRPKPQVSWTKDGLSLDVTSRVNVINTPTIIGIKITEACKEDFGRYSIKATNNVNTISQDLSIIVLDKPGPPKGPVKVVEVSNTFVHLAWDPPEYMGGCQVKSYIVEKRDTTTQTWQSVTTQLARTAIKIPKLKTGAEYQFRIIAENRYGKGSSLDSKSIVVQYPYKPPGPPGTPRVQSATKEMMIIEWNEPVNDGGSTVIGYHLESKERSSIMWNKLNKTLITDTQFKISNLEEGIGYEFRVYGENIVGIGRCSKVSESFVARDPCDPPGAPEAVSISKTIIKIQWTKPEYDGGSKVNGYIVERKDLASDEKRWVRANFTNIVETEYTVTGLTESEQYEFRVTARNAAGVFSEPSDSSGPITATDEIEPPRASMDPKYKDTIVINAGEHLVLDADIYGKPIPDVAWLKEGKEMPKALRIEVKTTQKRTAITIKDVTKLDSGHYDLVLKNPGGTKTFPITVKVLDKPGPPPGPMTVTGIMSDRCTLAWSVPTLDGGASITHYILEKRETSRLSWTVAAQSVKGTFYKLKNLLTGNEYIFRVKAVNKYGVGDCLESEPIIARNPYKPPSAPGTPEGSQITKDSIVLTWTLPEQSGGAEIDTFHLEKRDKDSVRWTKCNRQKLTDNHFKVTGLMTDHFYEFRVAAENEAGMGDLSELSLLYRACDSLTPPGPPHHPKVTDYTKSSVSLTWGKSDFDGGAYVKGYIVEMREYTPEPEEDEEAEVAPAIEAPVVKEWTMCTPPTGTQATKLTITDVKEGGEYQFRVCAINSEGVGEAASVHGTVVTSDRVEAPEIELDADLRKVVSVRAGGTLRLFVAIRGRPEPSVKWEKVDGALTDRAGIDTTSSYTMLVIDNVNRFDSGKYSLTLENSSGEKSAIVAVRILDTPSAPQSFAVKELKKDSVTLAWDTPLTDGGSKITNYIVEKRESVRKAYTTVTSNCLTNSFKIEELPEGGIFYFRVCAVNKYGQGQAVETKEIKVSEVPLPPNKVTLVDQTKTSVTLVWDKPAHDGGSKVMCYNVEFKPKSGDKWGTACTVKVTEATVPNLSPNEVYLFRVIAINEKGKSEPKDLGLPLRLEATSPSRFSEGRPKPVVSWKKDGLPLKQTSAVTILNTATSSKIILKEACREHVGKYEITLANTGGTVTADIGVVVLDKPSPPKAFKLDAVTSDSITLSWSLPEYDGGCSISNYIVEKRDTNTQEWQMVASNVARTSFKAGRLTHGAEYQFRIYAVNRYGKSGYLDTPGITAQYNFKQPGPPSTPIVKLATKSYMLVTWNEPVNDGGSPVVGYHLERKERTSIIWSKLNRGMIKETEYKVNGIEEGMMYEYRVYAENIAGIGKVSKACEAVAARDPCDPPGTPEVTAVTRTSVTLSWEKPEYDGGAKVTGYSIERRDLPEGRWTRCNFTNVPETHYDATGLTEDSQYDFRVIAKNAAGLFSGPSDTTGPITVKADVDPPRIMIDVKYRESLLVKAGETLKINADLAGRPAPVISWTKDGKEIELRARIQIVSTDTSTSLIVKDSVRRDSGQYVLTLKNIGGTVAVPIHCVILDKPGPAAGPLQITGLTAEACDLSWGPPQEAGGADITHYVVEKRETSRLAWTVVEGDVTKTYLKVTGLLKGNEYIFRVLAVNKHGRGETLDSDAVMITDPYTFASAPTGVDVTDITGTTMTLTWCKPASNGGSPVTGYVIERREKTGMRWVRVNRDLIVECTTVATKLRKGCEYDFRVLAENAAGLSPPSEQSATFRALDALVVPSRPTKPKTVTSNKDSVSIVWKPPRDDGGAPVLGYTVEYREYVHKPEPEVPEEEEEYEYEEEEEEVPESPEELARWVEAIPLTKSLEFTISGLKTDTEYEFCVKAINKVGSSTCSLYSDPATAMDRTTEPSFDVDIELRKVLMVKHGTAFTLKVPFKGKPVPSVAWAKEGVDLKIRGTIESTESSTSLTLEKATRNDSGEYCVTIESSLGTATLPMVVKVLDSPGPPVNVKVSAVTRDSATLNWEAPENDGGDAVKAYYVEKREASKKAWVTVTSNCHVLTYKVEDLQEGAMYYFRVIGENEHEVPSIPTKLGVANVTKDSVTIAWTRPEYDGGSRVTGYLIDALEKGQTKWVKCATVKTLNHTIKSLRECGEYYFRVRAENHAGLSEAKEMIVPVIVKEIHEAPEFDLKNYPKNTVYVKAGSDLTFELPLSGRPTPKVTMSKNNIQIKASKRLLTEVTPDSLIITLNESISSDAGRYEVTASNAGGTTKIFLIFVVLDRPGPPIGPVEVGEVGETTVCLKWACPEYDGGSPVTNYTVMRRQTSTPNWTEVSTSIARSAIKATKLTKGEEYQFRIRAQNRYGISDHIDTKPIMIKLPYTFPGPPSTPWFSFVSRESLTVCWNEPVNDGGSTVIGYHVQMKERSSILWQKVNKTAISGNQWRVTNICAGLIYEFKVSAENAAGIGKMSKTSEEVLAIDACEPPANVHVTEVTKNSVSLAWQRPPYDGGSKITGYSVERRDTGSGRWVKANFTNIIEMGFTVSGLNKDEAYEFRVYAKNAVGSVSNPSLIAGPITCVDTCGAPAIDLPPEFLDVVQYKAGSSVKLRVGIVAQLLPNIEWLKDGKELLLTSKLSIMFSWEPVPEPHQGGFPVTHYIVERRETSRLVWSTVSDCQEEAYACVGKLVRGNEYVFRVMAVNKFGVGEALVSEPVIAKNAFVTPGQPHTPEVNTITKTTMLVEWNKPGVDGGSLVTGYYLERRDKKSLRWIRVYKEAIADIKKMVYHLTEGNEYQYRVCAINRAGEGPFSEVSDYYKAADPVETPDEPCKLKVVDSTKTSITLGWSKPEWDGGSEVISYMLEKLVEGEEEWAMVTAKGEVKTTEYIVHDLKPDVNYFFRVSAVNCAGRGESLEMTEAVQAKDILGNKSLVLTHYIVKAGKDVELSVPLKGRPAPTASWSKGEECIDSNPKYEFHHSDNTTVLVMREVTRLDTGKYTVKIENGVGEPKTLTLSVKVQDTPAQCRNLVLKDVTRGKLTLCWEPPLLDGGAEITNYIVEKKDSSKRIYSAVTSKCTETTYSLEDLSEKASYFFRVMAENENGVGDPCDTLDPVKATETPGPVKEVSMKDSSKTSVTLQWLKPDYDGGSIISEYVIEQKLKDEEWSLGGTSRQCELEVKKLKEHSTVFFRVAARNDKGQGDFVIDYIITPEACLAEYPGSRISVRLGHNVHIELPYKGKPKPAILWLKDNLPLKESDQIRFKKTENKATLNIKNVTKENEGKYTLTLDNRVNRRSFHINVITLGPPSKPIGPIRLDEVRAESITISWDEPNDDGGGDIACYTVEKRDTSQSDWKMACSSVEDTQYQIANLIKGIQYQFRVHAENRYGSSEPLVSQSVIAKHQFRPPGPPGKPVVYNVTNDGMTIQWEQPIYDGGCPIHGFNVEKREKNSIMWQKVNTVLVKETDYRILELIEGLEYSFRVYAQNDAGCSRMSDHSKLTMAVSPVDPPGQPDYTDVTSDSVTLKWDAPKRDGGSKITSYSLEKRQGKGRWFKANLTDVHECEYTVTGLALNERYEFRVTARNAIGVVSPPSNSSGLIVFGPEYFEGLTVKAGDKIRLKATITGRPTPKVVWFRDGLLVTKQMMDIINVAGSSTLFVRDADRTHRGLYTVEATNGSGNRKQDILVQVQGTQFGILSCIFLWVVLRPLGVYRPVL